MSSETTRFAPSPTGYLHLGHAYAAIYAFNLSRETGGKFLVRIEDIDRGRCRPAFEEAIHEDLHWLGLEFEWPMRRQSENFEDYVSALEKLRAMGCAYPCFCTRKEIQAELAASAGAPQGPDGPIYLGTCRGLSDAERAARIAGGEQHAWRLDAARASQLAGGALTFEELGHGPAGETGRIDAQTNLFGDFVLARKDAPASYHLAVVMDDAIQGVTMVTRGNDLFASTHLHRLLQALLNLPVPRYSHHRLVLDAQGKRLAKRDMATGLRQLRAQGVTRDDVYRMLGFTSR